MSPSRSKSSYFNDLCISKLKIGGIIRRGIIFKNFPKDWWLGEQSSILFYFINSLVLLEVMRNLYFRFECGGKTVQKSAVLLTVTILNVAAWCWYYYTIKKIKYYSQGVDLNRNFAFKFAGNFFQKFSNKIFFNKKEGGTSFFPCSEIYHGPNAFSEPESRAVRDAIMEGDLKGRIPGLISMHAYSQV